jgi:hypothetical protein
MVVAAREGKPGQRAARLRQRALRPHHPAGPPERRHPAAISGRVERADGRPVPGAVLVASTNPVLEPEAHHPRAQTSTDQDGRFRLAPVEDRTSYTVITSLGGRDLATPAEVPGGTSNLIVRVAAPGRLRVPLAAEAVTGADGQFELCGGPRRPVLAGCNGLRPSWPAAGRPADEAPGGPRSGRSSWRR